MRMIQLYSVKFSIVVRPERERAVNLDVTETDLAFSVPGMHRGINSRGALYLARKAATPTYSTSKEWF
jgi:hypothetical protein